MPTANRYAPRVRKLFRPASRFPAGNASRSRSSLKRTKGFGKVGVARIGAEHAGSFSAKVFETIDLRQSAAYTPGGLPALVACGYAEQAQASGAAAVPAAAPIHFASAARRRWWLNYEARRFHDAEPRRLIDLSGGGSM